MRILVVTQYFHPEAFRINDLVQGLSERGHDVTVLTGKPNYPGGRFHEGYGFFGRSEERYGGARVVRVPLIPRRAGRGRHLVLNYLSFAAFACLIGPLRCRGAFDLLFVFEPSPVTVGLPAVLMRTLKRAPLLFWVQDLWPESLEATGAITDRRLLRMVSGLVRFIYRRCEQVLIQSRAFEPRVCEQGADPARVRYFPNSAEALYRPVARDPQMDRSLPQGFRVLFAGNIGAAQAFDTILAAARKLAAYRQIHWIVVGEGRDLDRIKSQATAAGLSHTVHFMGRHPVDSMPQWFAQADALLVTLRREPIFALTIPSKVQSYMACARPLIAALDGEGARVIEEAGAGLTVPGEDADALARAVLELSTMPAEQREAMGRLGREYFLKEFERDMLLDRLESYMGTAVAQRQPCAS